MALEDTSKVVDIVEEEARTSSPAKNVDRWTAFFDSFQITKTKELSSGKKETVKNRPYLDQIKKMSSSKPYLYSTNFNEPAYNSMGEMGTLLFTVNYQDLVNARSDMFGIYEAEKSKKKKEDREQKILNIKILCYQIRNMWDTTKVQMKHAVWNLLKIHDKAYANLIGDPDKIIIAIHNFEITQPISDISSKDLDKFTRMELLIAQFDDQSSIETLSLAYQCIKCSEIIIIPANKKPPTKCINCDHANTYTEEKSMRKVRDFMYFIGQDTTDKMRLGQTIANSINISASEMPFVKSIYNVIEVGLYVAVNGIVRLAEGNTKSSLRSNAEFECVGIEILEEKSKYDQEIRALVERDIPPEQIDEHYAKLKRSYAPHLQGLTLPKEGLLIHAASGGSLRDRDGSTRLRGRMQTLLLGDTGQGKSELIHFHERLNRHNVPTTGSHISRVGLTASIKKIETIRGGEKIIRQSIDPGPYGTCKGGDVCIDEWDKVANKDIYQAVASAMDNFQVLHVDKNAAHATIAIDCGSVHAANPTTNSGKYDTNISVIDQTNFAYWLWSRYDLKFLFLSNRTDESRHMLWQHKAKTMERMVIESEYNAMTYDQYVKSRTKEHIDILDGDIYPIDYLIQELAYVREKYPDPALKPNSMAWIMMIRFWNRFNKQTIIPDSAAYTNGDKPQFVAALDERGQDSMIRIAKAVARLHRRNVVTTEDMKITMDLMRDSIQQFIPYVDLSTEEEQEDIAAKNMVNETMRAAMMFTTREMNQSILKFYYAFVKVLKAVHHEYFVKCDICHGKGVISDKIGYTPDSADKVNYCPGCRNRKGHYKKLSFNEYEKICIDSGTSVYTNDFFGLMKSIKFLKKDDAVTTTVYYKVPPEIPSLISPRMLEQVQKAINSMFGMDEAMIMEQRKLLVKEQRMK